MAITQSCLISRHGDYITVASRFYVHIFHFRFSRIFSQRIVPLNLQPNTFSRAQNFKDAVRGTNILTLRGLTETFFCLSLQFFFSLSNRTFSIVEHFLKNSKTIKKEFQYQMASIHCLACELLNRNNRTSLKELIKNFQTAEKYTNR